MSYSILTNLQIYKVELKQLKLIRIHLLEMILLVEYPKAPF